MGRVVEGHCRGGEHLPGAAGTVEEVVGVVLETAGRSERGRPEIRPPGAETPAEVEVDERPHSKGVGMKVKQKIIETRAGFRCRVCDRRFRTEEAAFVHQSYNCSRDGR